MKKPCRRERKSSATGQSPRAGEQEQAQTVLQNAGGATYPSGACKKRHFCRKAVLRQDDTNVQTVDPTPLITVKIALQRPGAIGDIVMTASTVRALRRRYPYANIDYFCHPAIAPLITPLLKSIGIQR